MKMLRLSKDKRKFHRKDDIFNIGIQVFILICAPVLSRCNHDNQTDIALVTMAASRYLSSWQMSYSCRDKCGFGPNICNCDSLCFVYGICCSDIGVTCPYVMEEAVSRFEEHLLNSDVLCSESTGKYLISACRHSTPPGLEQQTDSLDIISTLRTMVPVYDNNTGLLYRNLSVLRSCVPDSEVSPIYWDARFLMDHVTDVADMTDLDRLLDNGDYPLAVSEPKDTIHKPVDCMFLPGSQGFSVLVDLSSTQNVQVSLSSKFEEIAEAGSWSKVLCQTKSQGQQRCSYESCGQLSVGRLDGQCLFYVLATVYATHAPDTAWTRDDITEIGEYLSCKLEDDPQIINASIVRVERNSSEKATIDSTLTIYSKQMLKSDRQTYFEIDFNVTYVTFQPNIGDILAKAFSQYIIVKVHTINEPLAQPLQFNPGSAVNNHITTPCHDDKTERNNFQKLVNMEESVGVNCSREEEEVDETDPLYAYILVKMAHDWLDGRDRPVPFSIHLTKYSTFNGSQCEGLVQDEKPGEESLPDANTAAINTCLSLIQTLCFVAQIDQLLYLN